MNTTVKVMCVIWSPEYFRIDRFKRPQMWRTTRNIFPCKKKNKTQKRLNMDSTFRVHIGPPFTLFGIRSCAVTLAAPPPTTSSIHPSFFNDTEDHILSLGNRV